MKNGTTKKPQIKMPKDIVFAITYDCNSRCRMCNIWKLDHKPTLSLDEIKKLPNTIKDINISGGEPFLRPDIVDVIRVIVEQNSDVRIIVNTNGFLKHLVLKRMKEIQKIKPDIAVAVSIDGYKEKHDEVRGIKHGYDIDISLIKELQAMGITDIRISFTAGDYNIEDLNKMYQVAKDLGVEYTMAAIHNSDTYFATQDNKIESYEQFKKEYEQLIKAEMGSWNPKRWARAYFTYGLWKFLTTGKRPLPNYNGLEALYIDPFGNVYPSVVSNKVMGNMKDFETFEDLLKSEQAQKAVAESLEKENDHWMICTVRQSMLKHPVQVLSWIVKSKLFGVTLG